MLVCFACLAHSIGVSRCCRRRFNTSRCPLAPEAQRTPFGGLRRWREIYFEFRRHILTVQRFVRKNRVFKKLMIIKRFGMFWKHRRHRRARQARVTACRRAAGFAHAVLRLCDLVPVQCWAAVLYCVGALSCCRYCCCCFCCCCAGASLCCVLVSQIQCCARIWLTNRRVKERRMALLLYFHTV